MKRTLTIIEEDLDAALKCEWSESTCLLAQTFARELNEEVIGLDYTLTVTTMKRGHMTHWSFGMSAYRIMRLFDHSWSRHYAPLPWPGAGLEHLRKQLPFEFEIEQVSTVDVQSLMA